MLVALALALAAGCSQGPPAPAPASPAQRGTPEAASPDTRTASPGAAGTADASRASPAGAGSSTEAAAPAAAASPPPDNGRCAAASFSSHPDVDAYKRAFACRVYARSADWLYAGAPPPVLRSVVVLSIRVDATGRPTRVSVYRSNRIAELERRAMASVREAEPLAPDRRLLRGGSAEFTETWLFRDDGRFQLRSLALVQAKAEP